MKIIDLKCPGCGANMEINHINEIALCPNCGRTQIIDDESITFDPDNAEEFGYRFEIGRQKARRNAIDEMYSNDPHILNALERLNANQKHTLSIAVATGIIVFIIILLVLLF